MCLFLFASLSICVFVSACTCVFVCLFLSSCLSVHVCVFHILHPKPVLCAHYTYTHNDDDACLSVSMFVTRVNRLVSLCLTVCVCVKQAVCGSGGARRGHHHVQEATDVR